MGLIEDIQDDIKDITTDVSEGFGVTLTFTAPTGEIAIISGLHTKIHFQIDPEGTPVNAKKAHVSFSEKLLTDLGYPLRNSDGLLTMRKHTVSVKDSTGSEKLYEVRETYPDETIGLIVCLLGDYTL